MRSHHPRARFRLILAFVASLLPAPAGRDPALAQDRGTLPLDEARDLVEDGVVRIGIAAERETYYVGEAIPVRLVVDIERAFLETRMIQPFRRELDVPVQIQADWMSGPTSADAEWAQSEPEAPPEPAAAGRPTFALGGAVVHADSLATRTEDGERRAVLSAVCVVRARHAGPLELAEPVMRFAFTTGFKDDLLQGRVPADRRDAYVRGKSLTLSILPLPEEGRPTSFTGAVGRFAVRAEVDRRSVAVGESFAFAWIVEGDGELDGFEPPRLASAGFDVRGTLDATTPGRRVVTYDLAPTDAALRGVPPVPFAFFDPGPPAGYRVVETAEVPLDVRPAPAPSAVARPTADLPPRAEDRLEEPFPSWIVGLACAGIVLLGWLVLRARSRRR